MEEKLKLDDFDILGVIALKDIKGIEKYVTPIFDKNNADVPLEYLSRSKEYYNVKSLTELSNEREELKALLTRERSKRNFVILENMLNCSGKVYYKKLVEYIESPTEINKHYLEIAKLCMLEDSKNLISILEGKGLINCNKKLILPLGQENCAKRLIEMDNKAILYLFAKHLNFEIDPDKIQIATPGYGSLYIGPFLKVLYGYDFTNILKSKYITESSGDESQKNIKNLVSNDRLFDKTKKVVLLDDNIGTGTTIEEIKSLLKEVGVDCFKTGAIQYNWRNYYRVYAGDKRGIDRFNTDKIDIITPFNYAGHKLFEHAIDMLHESGTDYIEYLQSKSYRISAYNDTIGAIIRGVISARKCGVDISTMQYIGKRNSESDKALQKTQGPLHRIDQGKINWIDSLIKDIQEDSDEINFDISR